MFLSECACKMIENGNERFIGIEAQIFNRMGNLLIAFHQKYYIG